MTGEAAEAWAGADGDFYIRDLQANIAACNFPSSDLHVQLMPVRGCQDLPFQPLRSHQDLAGRGLPTDQGRHHGAEPERGELLCADRAGSLRAVERRAGHRRVTGQDAASPHLFLRRRAPLPRGHQPTAGQPAQEPDQQLQPERPGMVPVQRPVHSGLRTKLPRRPGCRGAADPAGAGRRTLR